MDILWNERRVLVVYMADPFRIRADSSFIVADIEKIKYKWVVFIKEIPVFRFKGLDNERLLYYCYYYIIRWKTICIFFSFFHSRREKKWYPSLCDAVRTEESGSPPYVHDVWTITAVCLSARTPKSHLLYAVHNNRRKRQNYAYGRWLDLNENNM